jgi:hypothetical protein
MSEFVIGDTVVFDPESFNPEYWDKLSHDDKVKYYGNLYNFIADKPYLFTFIGYHRPQYGHCILVNMITQKVETMRHSSNFRIATEDEC